MCRCSRANIHTPYIYLCIYTLPAFDTTRLYTRYVGTSLVVYSHTGERDGTKRNEQEGRKGFIGSLERVSFPSRLSASSTRLRERKNVGCRRGIVERWASSSLSSLSLRCVTLSSSGRARERATAVEAGRPAGRRLISVARGRPICVLYVCANRDAVTPQPRRAASGRVASTSATAAAAGLRLPESRFPQETQGRVAPRRHSRGSSPRSLYAFTPNKHGARALRTPRLSYACDISSITARSVHTSVFHSYVA